jgi:hypothetical protein
VCFLERREEKQRKTKRKHAWMIICTIDISWNGTKNSFMIILLSRYWLNSDQIAWKDRGKDALPAHNIRKKFFPSSLYEIKMELTTFSMT